MEPFEQLENLMLDDFGDAGDEEQSGCLHILVLISNLHFRNKLKSIFKVNICLSLLNIHCGNTE